MKRITLNGGHSEINVAGQKYLADDEGCFTVKDDEAAELIRVHGGEFAPGIEVAIERAQQADETVANLKTQLEIAEKTAKAAHEAVGVLKTRMNKIAEEKRAKETPQNQGGQQQNNQNRNGNNPQQQQQRGK